MGANRVLTMASMSMAAFLSSSSSKYGLSTGISILLNYFVFFSSPEPQAHPCSPVFPWHSSTCSEVQFSGLSLSFSGCWHLQSHMMVSFMFWVFPWPGHGYDSLGPLFFHSVLCKTAAGKIKQVQGDLPKFGRAVGKPEFPVSCKFFPKRRQTVQAGGHAPFPVLHHIENRLDPRVNNAGQAHGTGFHRGHQDQVFAVPGVFPGFRILAGFFHPVLVFV